MSNFVIIKKVKRKYITIFSLIAISIIGFTIILCFAFPQSNEFPPIKPPIQDATGSEDDNDENQNILTESDFILVKDIVLTIDETEAKITYNLPDWCTQKPIFSIKSGNSITLNNENILPVNYGTTVIEATIEDIIKEVSVTVLNVEFSIAENLRCGPKFDGSFDLQTITITSNYAITNFSLTGSGVKNIDFISTNSNKTIANYTFELTEENALLIFNLDGFEFKKEIQSTKYISNIEYSLTNNLAKDQNNNYILYKISDTKYELDSLNDGNPSFTEIEIKSLEESNYTMTINSNKIILDNNIIYSNDVGIAELRISATDGSGYFITINFIVVETTANSVITNIDEIILNITDINGIAFITTYSPIYSSYANIHLIYDKNIIIIEDNIVSPKQIGNTNIQIYLNDTLVKQIPVTIKDVYTLKIINNKTEEEIISNMNINFATEQDISLLYEIYCHDNSLCKNQQLNITIIDEENIVQIYETVDRIYIKFKSTGNIKVKLINANLNINEELIINII